MDRHCRVQQSSETQVSNEEGELSVTLVSDSSSPVLAAPFATVSLSLSTLLSTKFIPPLKCSSIFSPPPRKVRIPFQISAVSQQCVSASFVPPRRLFKSLPFSSNPLQSLLHSVPRLNSDPSSAAGGRRATIVWFRNDLRVQDNECLNSANAESLSVLPVYCFDPRDYGKSSSGFDKTGPYRANFLIESVSNLRKSLQEKGSDLVVRIGKPETVLVDLAKDVGADAVYAHREVSHEEVKMEEKIQTTMKDEGVDVKYFWGSTLYHIEDLPFKLEEMPSNYSGFKEKVKGLGLRKTIAPLERLKGMPLRGNVESGGMPCLYDLGLNPHVPTMEDGKVLAMVGGEMEGLQKLRKFAAEYRTPPLKGSTESQNSICGANFSCKISPWLTVGCLSPRIMFDELKKTASRVMSSQKPYGSNTSDTGMNWLMYELLWRDFFRFITKKYSSVKKDLSAKPVTVFSGALT